MPDKGKVEGLVKYARTNFMTPIPVAASYDDLNAILAERCRTRQRAGRAAPTIGERLAADLTVLRNLPAVALEPCEKRAGRVVNRTRPLSLQRLLGANDLRLLGCCREGVRR
jgi:hypothetical protein